MKLSEIEAVSPEDFVFFEDEIPYHTAMSLIDGIKLVQKRLMIFLSSTPQSKCKSTQKNALEKL